MVPTHDLHAGRGWQETPCKEDDAETAARAPMWWADQHAWTQREERSRQTAAHADALLRKHGLQYSDMVPLELEDDGSQFWQWINSRTTTASITCTARPTNI
jgi:hypothetical protein